MTSPLCSKYPVWNVLPECPVDTSFIYIYRLPGKYSQAALPNRPRWIGCISLVDKSVGIFDFRGNTSSNTACVWSCHTIVQLFPQQSPAFTKLLCTGLLLLVLLKKIIRFVRQCKATLSLYSGDCESSCASKTCAV